MQDNLLTDGGESLIDRFKILPMSAENTMDFSFEQQGYSKENRNYEETFSTHIDEREFVELNTQRRRNQRSKR